jgi:hypothetical protein
MKPEFSRISIFGSNEEEKNLKLSKLPKNKFSKILDNLRFPLEAPYVTPLTSGINVISFSLFSFFLPSNYFQCAKNIIDF